MAPTTNKNSRQRRNEESNEANNEETKAPLLLPAARSSAPGIQVYKHGDLPNNRPIGIDTLEISETLSIFGNRPVSKSHLKILEMVGNRPVMASEMLVSEFFDMSGHRPVGVSGLVVTEVYGLNRPVASNDTDDSGILMGYLD